MNDTDGRLLFANPSTLAVVGKSAEQVIGKTDAELYDRSRGQPGYHGS